MSVQENRNGEKQEKNDIVIRARRHIDVVGVREVLSFDESSISMMTTEGELLLEGEELKIETLDTERGVVSADGKINSVIYYDRTDGSEKKSLFGKLFNR